VKRLVRSGFARVDSVSVLSCQLLFSYGVDIGFVLVRFGDLVFGGMIISSGFVSGGGLVFSSLIFGSLVFGGHILSGVVSNSVSFSSLVFSSLLILALDRRQPEQSAFEEFVFETAFRHLPRS